MKTTIKIIAQIFFLIVFGAVMLLAAVCSADCLDCHTHEPMNPVVRTAITHNGHDHIREYIGNMHGFGANEDPIVFTDCIQCSIVGCYSGECGPAIFKILQRVTINPNWFPGTEFLLHTDVHKSEFSGKYNTNWVRRTVTPCDDLECVEEGRKRSYVKAEEWISEQ